MLMHQEKRSALKRKARRTKQQEDITKCKKQRNLVVKLNREMKLHYFNYLETSKNSKPFWNKRKPHFSNKNVHGDSKILLNEKEEIRTNTNEIVEKETLLANNDEIAKTFDKHFAEMIEKLNTFEWPSNDEDLTKETLTRSLKNSRTIQVLSKLKINI